MAAGSHYTDELLRDNDKIMIDGGAVPPCRDKCIYMDDRSFTSECPYDIMRQVGGWEECSEKVGFKENRSKLQLTAWSAEKREELRKAAGGFKESVKESIVILGIGTVGNYGRTTDGKEEERLPDGIRRTRRIKHLPCDYRTKQYYISAFGMSKASYGWITRTPPVKESNKFDSATRCCPLPVSTIHESTPGSQALAGTHGSVACANPSASGNIAPSLQRSHLP